MKCRAKGIATQWECFCTRRNCLKAALSKQKGFSPILDVGMHRNRDPLRREEVQSSSRLVKVNVTEKRKEVRI